MQGLHLTADLHNCRCDAQWLTNAPQLAEWCTLAVRSAGLEPVNQQFHAFAGPEGGPGGITVTLLLAASHVAVHAWSGQKAVTLDVYICDNIKAHGMKAKALMQALVDRFTPEWTEQRSLDRGDEA
jgi:S-adenosylmethionine decarboxylase